jgi:hypothetical protein
LALRGGGGSTFGAVTVTSFAFGGIDPIASYNATWADIRAFFSHFIDFSSTETYSYFFAITSPTSIFQMAPFFASNMTISATQTLLKPWFDASPPWESPSPYIQLISVLPPSLGSIFPSRSHGQKPSHES